MTVFVALLRGINLGAHKKVAMGDLRDLSVELGLSDPETYARSGNLIVATDHSEDDLARTLQSAMNDRFGFDIPVICRPGPELLDIARSHPFSDLGLDQRLLHVAFLDEEPAGDPNQVIDADSYAPDRFVADGREVYLAYPDGSARSTLTHAVLEKALQVSATARNWRTVTKLAEMVRSRR